MKRLLFLYLLLSSSLVYADTNTNGNVVTLIKITTGAIDRTRSWGDKYNDNFQEISDGMDFLNTSISTSIIDYNSKITSLYSNVGSTYSSLTTAINSTNTAMQTAINSTFTQLTSGYVSAINSTNTALTTLINAKVSTVGIYNSMSLIGGASYFNFTGSAVTGLTVTVGTATITLTDNSGGSTGSSTFTYTFYFPGDAAYSSMTFSAAGHPSPPLGVSTWNVSNVQIFALTQSTITTKWAIYESTGEGRFTNITGDLSLPARPAGQGRFTVTFSTAFKMIPNYAYQPVCVDDGYLTDAGALKPANVHMVLKYWKP